MKILVVEDQASIRTMIEVLVRSNGHEVHTATDGARAIELALKIRPDVILLDLNLPGAFDGIAVCERVKADDHTKHADVVMITAMGEDAVREKAMSAGASAYYEKPFSPVALLKELDRLANQRG